MVIARFAFGFTLGLAALVAAVVAIFLPTSSKLEAVATGGVLVSALALTFAVFPLRVLGQSLLTALRVRKVNPLDLERALHVAMFTGTTLVAVGLLFGFGGLLRHILFWLGRLDAAPGTLLMVAIAPVAATLLLRLVLIEPLKASLRGRLRKMRAAHG